jgi:hypothetical protein
MVEGSMFIQIHVDERYGCPLIKNHIEGRKQEKLHSMLFVQFSDDTFAFIKSHHICHCLGQTNLIITHMGKIVHNFYFSIKIFNWAIFLKIELCEIKFGFMCNTHNAKVITHVPLRTSP